MITIEISNVEYNIPTQWEDITVRQYEQLILNADAMNHVRLLSIFTGIPYDSLNNLPCDEFTLKVIPEMKFMTEEFSPFSLPRRKKITIGSTEVDTIQDPSKERFGQKLYMQQLTHNAIVNNLNHITLVAPVLSCYYAPYLHPEKKWDEYHVKTLQQVVYDMKVVEAFPEADFFLRGYIRYAPTKITY